MKRIITLLLVLALTLSLCACGGSKSGNNATEAGKADSGAQKPADGNAQGGDAAAADTLQVGYARVNITPDYSVGLAGYSDDDTRRSEGFRTYIYMTCIAVTSGADTFLLYTFDGLSCAKTHQDRMRQEITAKVKEVPADHIFIGATHCHSAPTLTTSYEGNDKYYPFFLNSSVEAAQKAMEDRAPAKMLAATPIITDENGKYMNFVRHYEMADGTHAGSNFGDFSKKIVGHSAESDPQMVLVKFDYADESKQDVLMVNWQAHPDRGSELGRTLIAASWIGPLRDELEKLSGLRVAYFTGASGNQNADSKISEEAHNLDWIGYGTKMGQLTNAALDQLKPVEGTELKQTNMLLELDIDHSWDGMLAEANEVYDLWKSAGKTAGDALGKKYGFTSSYQARAIRSRAKMPKTDKLEIRAFKIGPIGFTTGTYEMFSTHGLYVKQNSPFDITFLITANSSYLPDVAAYEYRSYEADTGYFAPGSAEKLAEAYVQMLNEIK